MAWRSATSGPTFEGLAGAQFALSLSPFRLALSFQHPPDLRAVRKSGPPGPGQEKWEIVLGVKPSRVQIPHPPPLTSVNADHHDRTVAAVLRSVSVAPAQSCSA